MFVAKLLLSVLSNEDMKLLTSDYFNSKEKYFMVLDIFLNVFKPFENEAAIKRYRPAKSYVDALESFFKFTIDLLTKNMLPPTIEHCESDIKLKAITSLLTVAKHYDAFTLIEVLPCLTW